MCESCNHEIEKIWRRLAPGQVFITPDFLKGVNFFITYIKNDLLRIRIRKGSIVRISKNSFVNALHYLNTNGHNETNPCQIRSSDNPELPGPLCRISRQVNNNVRCINYILPILAENEIVKIDSNRPNRTWFL